MQRKFSKVQQIYEVLRGQIEAGAFRAGELLPTDMELSSRFETSRPTVAKAIQRLVGEGFLLRRAGLGTYLKSDDSKGGMAREFTFGLLIPSLGETEIFEPICGQIAQLADLYGYHLLWGGASLSSSKSQEIEQLAQKYIAQKVDGVFFNPLELVPEAEQSNRKILSMFEEAGIAVVLLDSDIVAAPEATRYDLVGINNLEAGYVMGRHLVECSSKKIAFYTRPYAASTVGLRWLGLSQALERHQGVEAEKFCIEDRDEQVIQDMLSRDFDAIVASNDAMAAELMKKLVQLGHCIPKKVRLCGFDDVKYAELLKVPLTTYRQPCRDIGIAAVETMMSRLKSPGSSPRRVLLLGELCIREST